MRFEKALTEEEIQKAMFIEDGSYNYKIIRSTEKISKKTGNDYIALELVLWDKAGKERLVFCNLWSMKLLKHFCDVNNMEADYKSCDIPDYKFVNRSGGKVLIGFEPEKDDGNGGIYKAKNVVIDFIKDENNKVHSKKEENISDLEKELDGDIPF
ncbi:MAG: hypothetical protein Q8936_14170 [Bacillota bacterium]|nr:hypothetical protein [Bacillota bacterium]